ncbi:pyridoxamine 5'-phosphate oxidase family protein [Gordonia sp. CPCC 205333]|uniref:pyridoxamine 5'-phosphate oxidase family protein n=1 Tax=Gordonia sp. CPCC 205333 TaxID=3140790 RepID=UPI003AF35AF3
MNNTHQHPGSDGEHALQHEYGTTRRAHKFYADQMRAQLNDEMIEFIGRMDMAFIATADAHGEADSSFRAGPPGFIHVLDADTICYPEYRGNGVMASLGNISENPHVGIMLIDFVRDRIGLHINGRATIVPDEELRAQVRDLPEDSVRGRVPDLWVRVDVHEAYIHCRKHIPAMIPADAGSRAWGTDSAVRKGGDYFGVSAARRAAEPRAAM